MKELSAKEAKWSYFGAFVIFVAMCLFAGLSGCATNKPVEVIEPVVCPETYVKQYSASQRQVDRYESALSKANASLNACNQEFDKNLSKSR